MDREISNAKRCNRRRGSSRAYSRQSQTTMSSAFFEPGDLSTRKIIPAAAASQSAVPEACGEAAQRGAIALLDLQKPDGHWCGDLMADTPLESDYILLQLWLDPPRDGVWQPRQGARIEKACRSIVSRQLPDGGFWIYPGGPADVIFDLRI